uniref:Uncharacterized protein n=1 Tax=Lotharella oceanica TaxID=641309 RepID=A0A7S2U4A9_9EUKA|mmetsp:Transcript_6794/g.13483  ORF Transcript_6794/g.13483 Transcript_6794/m.13483 type:complete len:294 (+) Transcript_6794:95-976(+)|eukprot:CAMPEP_0170168110 /NCGR_PEP_ID=MMETSP0040_2-20121228/1284_1 /TAXON_ID=641309 /ORGANISM="Lotharella oceanica, Strain CCMP622" /LENGTH=293 /DNA_ID=CAMNT_0010406305 /DNA_START=71 /DNA_END=952 /DNA_ORIENTATION=+
MDPRSLMNEALRKMFPWYILWLIDHPVVFVVVAVIVALIIIRLLAGYARMIVRVCKIAFTIGFISSHVGAVTAAWATLPGDAGFLTKAVALLKALTLPSRMLLRTLLSPFTSIIETARTVAGIVAGPLLEVIWFQGKILFGMTRVLFREVLLGYLILVSVLYYHCKSWNAARVIVSICTEVDAAVAKASFSKQKAEIKREASGPEKPKGSRPKSSLHKTIVRILAELPLKMFGLIPLIARSKARGAWAPMLNLVCAGMLAGALYPLRDFMACAFFVKFGFELYGAYGDGKGDE